MKEALKKLLNRLDAIARDHAEIGDTDVREQMFDAVYHGLIAREDGYELPGEFGMYAPEGNAAVRAALAEFMAKAQAAGPGTPEGRFEAFQNAEVQSDAGHAYDEYFGHGDSFAMVAAAYTREASTVPEAPQKAWWQFWK